ADPPHQDQRQGGVGADNQGGKRHQPVGGGGADAGGAVRPALAVDQGTADPEAPAPGQGWRLDLGDRRVPRPESGGGGSGAAVSIDRGHGAGLAPSPRGT